MEFPCGAPTSRDSAHRQPCSVLCSERSGSVEAAALIGLLEDKSIFGVQYHMGADLDITLACKADSAVRVLFSRCPRLAPSAM